MLREKIDAEVTLASPTAVRDYLRDEANKQTKDKRKRITEGQVIEQLVAAESPEVKKQLEETNGISSEA